jgi:hypothetical protein
MNVRTMTAHRLMLAVRSRNVKLAAEAAAELRRRKALAR